MIRRLQHFLKHRIGLDRAIAATSLTQLMRFVTGPITMVLIIRHFTPVEQGFFYSFGGVLGLQVFLEAGFAQSIMQFTSREFASLRFHPSGCLTGNPAALSRLRSLFQQANRYYRIMAAVLVLVLGLGGYWFFSTHPSQGVPWQIPWIVACAGAGVSFLITPVWAFLEGCNRVADVATYRLWSGLCMFAVNAVGLMLGFGIYVVVWGAAFSLAFPLLYLTLKWRHLMFQILRPPGKELISWRTEVWGFQWRIAMIWGLKYLLFPITPALAFAIFGPIVAGKVGLCYQLAFMGGAIGSTWTVTKIPRWGTMIAQGRSHDFRREWKIASRFHIGVVLISQLCTLLVVTAIHFMGFEFSNRFLSPYAFAGFALGISFHSFWLIFTHYFRANRQEPLVMTTAIAVVIYLVTALLLRSHGSTAITYAFALANLIGALTSFAIWKKKT